MNHALRKTLRGRRDIFRQMKRMMAWLLVVGMSMASVAVCAQEDPTQQQIDQINGRIQDLIDAQAVQGKRIEALEKEISDLQDELNQPIVNNSASQDDLNRLNEQVQALAKKQADDNQSVVTAFEKIAMVGGGAPSGRKVSSEALPAPAPENSNPREGSTDSQRGYEYTIHRGDTIMAIAKAYRDQGIKVTWDQILKANPGLDPKNLVINRKIFIPASAP